MVKISSYSEEELNAVFKPLLSASQGRNIDRQRLRDDLEGILVATGLLAGTDAEIAFSEAVARQAFHAVHQRWPDNELELALAPRIPASRAAAIKALRYRMIAEAPDDRFEALLSEAIQQDGVVETELRAALRHRRVRQVKHGGDAWRTDIKTLRPAAARLALFHKSLVHVGSPPRQNQAVLLGRLAEIWLRHTGSDGGPETVPHAIKSHFISFAYAALLPFVREVTRARLSSAWARLKKSE